MTRRLLLSYLSITALVLLALEVPLGVTFARAERDRLVSAVERDASVLATYAEEALEADDPSGLQPLATQYNHRTGGRVVLVDRQGITVGDSEPPAPGRRDLSTRPEIATALQGRRTTGTRASTTLHTSFLYVAVPVASQGSVVGAVRITYPLATVEARIQRLCLALAGVALVVLAAVTLLGSWLARSVTRPLRGLEAATAALANGDLNARAPTGAGPPELRRLAAAFNDMAARLARLVNAQRAFVADASHQLRTPLTALRLRLENLEPWITTATTDLQAAIAETSRLARLVDGLLTLARAEAGGTSREIVDLALVINDRCATWTPLAAEQHVQLLAHHDPTPTPVWALRSAPEQILDNLLANALRATPPGSHIQITTHHTPDWVELHVADQGPGLPRDAACR